MKLKITSLVEFHELYESTLKGKTMSIRLAYKFNQIENLCKEKVEFFNNSLASIITKYCEKNEDGQPLSTDNGKTVQIKKDCIEVCNNELQELNNLEVEIPDYQISIDDLESLSLTLKEVNILMPFLKESNDNDDEGN